MFPNTVQTGMCRNRALCGGAHGHSELRPGGGGHVQEVGRGVHKTGGGGSSYKTQPCRNMKETGHCSYGSSCQYAHTAQVSLVRT